MELPNLRRKFAEDLIKVCALLGEVAGMITGAWNVIKLDMEHTYAGGELAATLKIMVKLKIKILLKEVQQ